MWPGAGKALIRHTPQEQRVRCVHDFSLILAHLVIHHHPAHGFGWVCFVCACNEAIKGDPCCGNDLSHALLLPRWWRIGRRHYDSPTWRRLVQKRSLLRPAFLADLSRGLSNEALERAGQVWLIEIACREN